MSSAPTQTMPANTNPAFPQRPPLAAQAASLTQTETALAQQLAAAKRDEAVIKNPEIVSTAHQKVVTLEKQIQQIHSQKVHLEQELTTLKSQLANQQPAALSRPAASHHPLQSLPTQSSQNIRNIPQSITKSIGLPHVSDTPNVIVGIVKDSRGNVLPNMLVEVKDKDGNPVRAFKTNPLGQFASATPLAVGMYSIELEDPKKLHSFDVIRLTTNNQIMMPIEIISHDAREELRKQLFN
jgi:hypothetical protein